MVTDSWSVVRDIWPAFSDLDANIDGFAFQTREWLDAWLGTQSLSEQFKPVFVILEDSAGAPCAFFPLGVTKRFGLSILTFLGGGSADYQAPLVCRDAVVGEQDARILWSTLKTSQFAFDVAHFDKAVELLAGEPNPLLAWGARAQGASGRAAELSGTWDDWFDQRFSREAQRTLRRKRKRLDELGTVEPRFASGLDEALQWLQQLFSMKAERMSAVDERNALLKPGVYEFYKRLTRADPGLKNIKVFALTLDNAPIALQWSVAVGGCFTNILTSYAGGPLARYSPSFLAARYLMESCFAQGYRTVDFGLGNEEYKGQFCDPSAKILTNIMRARTVAGWTYVLAYAVRHILRRSHTIRRVLRLTQQAKSLVRQKCRAALRTVAIHRAQAR